MTITIKSIFEKFLEKLKLKSDPVVRKSDVHIISRYWGIEGAKDTNEYKYIIPATSTDGFYWVYGRRFTQGYISTSSNNEPNKNTRVENSWINSYEWHNNNKEIVINIQSDNTLPWAGMYGFWVDLSAPKGDI